MSMLSRQLLVNRDFVEILWRSEYVRSLSRSDLNTDDNDYPQTESICVNKSRGRGFDAKESFIRLESLHLH